MHPVLHNNDLLPLILSRLSVLDLQRCKFVCRYWRPRAQNIISHVIREMRIQTVMTFARENLGNSFSKSGCFFTNPGLVFTIKFDAKCRIISLHAPNLPVKIFINEPPDSYKAKILFTPYCKADQNHFYSSAITPENDRPVAFAFISYEGTNGETLEPTPGSEQVQLLMQELLVRLNALAESCRRTAQLRKDWLTHFTLPSKSSLESRM